MFAAVRLFIKIKHAYSPNKAGPRTCIADCVGVTGFLRARGMGTTIFSAGASADY